MCFRPVFVAVATWLAEVASGISSQMFGSLITRPARFATRGVRITLQGAQGALDLAGAVVGSLTGLLGGHDDAESAPDEPHEPRQTSAAPPTREPAPPVAEPAAPPPPPPPPPPATPAAAAAPAPSAAPVAPEPVAPEPLAPQPVHVSESPELVDEVADPGAEDGAGAQIRIAEPWEGYRAMKAADVIDRLASSSAEELATVELYELAGRNRKSVVAAAQKALKRASPPR
jgi:hypothetical protein